MVICLERGADLHMAQLMPLPLTISCFCKIQIGFTFLVPAHLGNPGKMAVKRVCVCFILVPFALLLNPNPAEFHGEAEETVGWVFTANRRVYFVSSSPVQLFFWSSAITLENRPIRPKF